MAFEGKSPLDKNYGFGIIPIRKVRVWRIYRSIEF